MTLRRAAIPSLNHFLGETIDIIRQTVRDFAENEIAPRAQEIDQSNEFPNDLWPKLGELGLPHVTRPNLTKAQTVESRSNQRRIKELVRLVSQVARISNRVQIRRSEVVPIIVDHELPRCVP